MGIFSNLLFLFSVPKLNITAHGWEISGPKEATSAIVGKGDSLEDVDKMKKNVSSYRYF